MFTMLLALSFKNAYRFYRYELEQEKLFLYIHIIDFLNNVTRAKNLVSSSLLLVIFIKTASDFLALIFAVLLFVATQ
jgi:hypothetical protein